MTVYSSPLQTRRLNGSLNRMPPEFYDRVWKILERTKGGIGIAGSFLPQVNKTSEGNRNKSFAATNTVGHDAV